MPDLERHFRHRSEPELARAHDDGIDASEALERRAYDRLVAFERADVARDEFDAAALGSNFFDERSAALDVSTCGDDRRALLGKPLGDPPPHAARRARYDGYLVLELSHARTSLGPVSTQNASMQQRKPLE